jgi:hypothetical protein
MEMSTGNGRKVQYYIEFSCHVHAPATLILREQPLSSLIVELQKYPYQKSNTDHPVHNRSAI